MWWHSDVESIQDSVTDRSLLIHRRTNSLGVLSQYHMHTYMNKQDALIWSLNSSPEFICFERHFNTNSSFIGGWRRHRRKDTLPFNSLESSQTPLISRHGGHCGSLHLKVGPLGPISTVCSIQNVLVACCNLYSRTFLLCPYPLLGWARPRPQMSQMYRSIWNGDGVLVHAWTDSHTWDWAQGSVRSRT